MMETILELGEEVGNLSRACDVLEVPRASLYRAVSPPVESKSNRQRKPSPRAISPETKALILDHLVGT
jgi:hypothetical protein